MKTLILFAGLAAAILVMSYLVSLRDTVDDSSQEVEKCNPEGIVVDEVFVKFKAGVSEPQKAEVRRDNNATFVRTIEGIDVEILKVPAGSVRKTVDDLGSNLSVEYAEPVPIYCAIGDTGPNECSPDEVVVSFRPGTSGTDRSAILRRIEGQFISEIEGLETLRVPYGSVEAAVQVLRQAPLVKLAEPNCRGRAGGDLT